MQQNGTQLPHTPMQEANGKRRAYEACVGGAAANSPRKLDR